MVIDKNGFRQLDDVKVWLLIVFYDIYVVPINFLA